MLTWWKQVPESFMSRAWNKMTLWMKCLTKSHEFFLSCIGDGCRRVKTPERTVFIVFYVLNIYLAWDSSNLSVCLSVCLFCDSWRSLTYKESVGVDELYTESCLTNLLPSFQRVTWFIYLSSFLLYHWDHISLHIIYLIPFTRYYHQNSNVWACL